MNQTAPTVIDLGYCVARLEDNRLTIISPQDVGDYYSQAQSVSIYGEKNILALRDALNKAYPIEPPF